MNGTDAYVRSVDHVTTTNLGTTTFVDFAISCGYLDYLYTWTNTHSPPAGNWNTNLAWPIDLPCGGTWKVQLASIKNDDHQKVNTDVAGGATLSLPSPVTMPGEVATYAILERFGASVQGHQVLVEWETQSELGTQGFELQRQSADGDSFETLNETLISGQGAAGEGGRYASADPGAFPGETYTYRLIEVEANGNRRTVGDYSVTPSRSKGRDQDATAGLSPGDYSYHRRAQTGPEQARSAARKAEKNDAARNQAKRAPMISGNLTGTAHHGAVIDVDKTGLHLVAGESLAQALDWPYGKVKGLIQAGELRLTHQGQEVAWWPQGKAEGLYFYGQATESLYDPLNHYLVEQGKGARMKTANVAPRKGAADPLASFPTTRQFEENLFAATARALTADGDYWHWVMFNSTRACDDPALACRDHSLRIQVPAAAPTGDAQLVLRLRGASTLPASPDHNLSVSINGKSIGGGAWDGYSDAELVIPFDQSILQNGLEDGTITVLIHAFNGAGVAYDYSYLEDLTLTYRRLYRPKDDSLIASADTNSAIIADGFSAPEVQLLDLTDPHQPVHLSGAAITKSGNGYRVGFIPVGAKVPHLIAGPAALITPAVRPMLSTGLKGAVAGAEYLLIAPAEFADAAAPLIDLRSGQGLSALFVPVEAIYDDYGYGARTPFAIRAFLADAAANWKQPPGYVVLGGKGTYDPKDYLGYGTDRVPVLMALTGAGMIAADQRFVDQDGDRVGDIPIGRLPAATAAEMAVMAAKIVTYETTNGARPNRLILLADGPDKGGDFTSSSESLAYWAEQAGYTDNEIRRIHLEQMSVSAARAALLPALDQGSELLNYFGHSGILALDHNLLTQNDVVAMANRDRMPFVVGMTCLMNRFEFPMYSALGESLVLQPGGGAAAVWSPGGFSFNAEATQLDDWLFQTLYQDGEDRIGDATSSAIKAFIGEHGPVSETEVFNLLGDPATRWSRAVAVPSSSSQ